MKILLLGLSSLIAVCCNTKVPLTGCNHYSGWCDQIRDISVKSWKYAQLSKNVYEKEFQYDVSEYFEKLDTFPKNRISFYAALYRDKSNQQLVLVFRGTDSFKDFPTGNFPFKPAQNEYALDLYSLFKRF